MRKKDTRPQFLSSFAKREAKVCSLKAENNPDARRRLKEMNVHNYGGAKPNAKGMWAPRTNSAHPVKCSVKNKTRHTTVASKAIMRGLA